jgi:hypothetical protein
MRVEFELKQCANPRCERIMERKRYAGALEKPSAYRRRQFCGYRCAYDAFRDPEPAKRCRLCRVPLERKRRPGGRLETMPAYRRRRTCDQECFAEWVRKYSHVQGRLISQGWRRRRRRLRAQTVKQILGRGPLESRVCIHLRAPGNHCEYCERIPNLASDPRCRYKLASQWAKIRGEA